MLDIIQETIVDNLKIFPFLYIAYLIMEWFEHKTSEKTTALIQKAGKAGPLIGALLGIIPQCGFSVVGANLYAARIITRGTLIAIFLSTSDELLPILISNNAPTALIAKIIGYKFLCGVIFGYLIDLWRKKKKYTVYAEIELQDHHDCCPNIWQNALRHAFKIALFIFVITLVLNTAVFYNENKVQALATWLQIPLLGEMISGLIGLFPNCASSVLLTQFYLGGYINFGTLMSGSLVGGGIGLLVLFKVNRPLKQNFKIITLLYVCGLIGGIIANLIG